MLALVNATEKLRLLKVVSCKNVFLKTIMIIFFQFQPFKNNGSCHTYVDIDEVRKYEVFCHTNESLGNNIKLSSLTNKVLANYIIMNKKLF